MKTTIRKLGNSHGVIIPQMMLLQAGIQEEAEMSVEKGTIVLRKPANAARAGWGEASKRIAAAGDPEPEWS
jgi:antitoxin MazE